jgi:hypothetical protein
VVHADLFVEGQFEVEAGLDVKDVECRINRHNTDPDSPLIGDIFRQVFVLQIRDTQKMTSIRR